MRPLQFCVLLGGCLAVGMAVAPRLTRAEEKPEVPDPAFVTLGRFVGGHWVTAFKTPDGKPVGDLRYQWGPDRKSIRGEGAIAGEPVDVRCAWDPVAKKVYYLDSHGPQNVYFGYFSVEKTSTGEEIVNRFRSIVGTPGQWESHGRFVDADHYEQEIHPVKDGKLLDAHTIRLHREP